MSCLFNHGWIYDFRHQHVYRKCQYCGVAQLHVKNKGAVYTAWEPVRERTHIESEQRQRQMVQKRFPALVRLAHTLRLLRTRTTDRTEPLARIASREQA
jgi:hypothetical protein